MRKFITFLILAALLTSTIACGETELPNNELPDDSSSSETTAEEEYVYPELDLEGYEFNILNTAQTYNFYSTLDLETQTGDTVDDAVFNRNRTLEEQFKINIVVDDTHQLTEANETLRKLVLANEDVYDVAFLRDFWVTSLLTEGGLIDMQDVEEFNFDKPWWDSEAIEEARIGEQKKIFYAYTDASLVDFEGTLVTFINEDYMTDLQLDSPYDMVREGKWTLDRYAEFIKAGANLNGDESFSFSESGNAKYGVCTWDQGEVALIFGAGCTIVAADADGQPQITAKGEKFIDVVQKVIKLCSGDGEYIFASGSPVTHYETLFKQGRSLLMLAQLKAANTYRDMEASYGILPIPKWDEEQESYRNLRTYCYVMCIPSISDSVDETAVIMDAMSYLTYKNVMPVFYSGRVSQKTLRNDDSIEMLEIIRDSRVIDLAIPYGWSDIVRKPIRTAVTAKSEEIVSQLESVMSSLESSIEEVMELLN